MNTKGFTLIELLLVISLIAISVGVTSDVVMSLVRSYTKSGVINEVEQQANFVGLKIEKELRNASNVTIPIPEEISFAYGGATVYYRIINGNLYRSTTNWPDGSNANEALVATPQINGTIGGVTVSCDGNCFELNGASPQVVTLSLVFGEGGGTGAAFRGVINVKNTVVIRNSY